MVDLEQKTDFIAKDALARIKAQGASRKLVGVEIAGDSLGSYNDTSMVDVFPIDHRGKRVGRMTSACRSPRREKNIDFAMVPIELAGPRGHGRDRAVSGGADLLVGGEAGPA